MDSTRCPVAPLQFDRKAFRQTPPRTSAPRLVEHSQPMTVAEVHKRIRSWAHQPDVGNRAIHLFRRLGILCLADRVNRTASGLSLRITARTTTILIR